MFNSCYAWFLIFQKISYHLSKLAVLLQQYNVLAHMKHCESRQPDTLEEKSMHFLKLQTTSTDPSDHSCRCQSMAASISFRFLSFLCFLLFCYPSCRVKIFLSGSGGEAVNLSKQQWPVKWLADCVLQNRTSLKTGFPHSAFSWHWNSLTFYWFSLIN